MLTLVLAAYPAANEASVGIPACSGPVAFTLFPGRRPPALASWLGNVCNGMLEWGEVLCKVPVWIITSR